MFCFISKKKFVLSTNLLSTLFFHWKLLKVTIISEIYLVYNHKHLQGSLASELKSRLNQFDSS